MTVLSQTSSHTELNILVCCSEAVVYPDDVTISTQRLALLVTEIFNPLLTECMEDEDVNCKNEGKQPWSINRSAGEVRNWDLLKTHIKTDRNCNKYDMLRM